MGGWMGVAGVVGGRMQCIQASNGQWYWRVQRYELPEVLLGAMR